MSVAIYGNVKPPLPVNDAVAESEAGPRTQPSEKNVPPRIPTERYDLRIFRAVRKIIRSTDQYSRKITHEFGVTVPQLVCLLKVVEEGPISIRRIAQEVFLSPSTLVGIIDRLEKQQLVTRNRQSKDRRLVMILATEKGAALARKSPSPLQDSLANALEGISNSEQSTIAKSLERIVELMEIKKIDTAPFLETTSDLVVPAENKLGSSAVPDKMFDL